MIKTMAMQAREQKLPSSVLAHFQMNETSGLYVSNQVNGSQYTPSQVAGVTPGNEGYLDFSESNAVGIRNNSDALSTPCNFDVTVRTDKVLILASCVRPMAEWAGSGTYGTRTAIGTVNESAVFTNSNFNNMHGGFMDYDQTQGSWLEIPASGYEILDNSSPFVQMIMWNGVDTVTLRLLNLDGTLHNNGTNNMERTVGLNIGQWTQDEIQLGNMSRLTNGYYYAMTLWQLDAVPNQLNLKLANWGNLVVSGHKGAIDLI